MPGFDVIIVGVVVAVALAWAARGIYRVTRRKPVCSDCASSGGCPVVNDPEAMPLGSECSTTSDSTDKND